MKKLTVVLIVIGLIVSSMAIANPGGPDKRDRGPDNINIIQRFADDIGLSDQQEEQLKAEHLAVEKDVIQLRADVKIARLEMRQLMDERSPDEAAVFHKIEAIGDLQTQIKKLKAGERINVNKILTEVQFEQLQDLKQEFRKDRRDDQQDKRGREGKKHKRF